MNPMRELPFLYRLPRGVCCWGGGGGGVGDITQAGQIQSQAAQQAASTEQQYLDKALGLLGPWQQTGAGAERALGDFFTGGVDQTKMLEKWPGYSFLKDQMNKSMLNYASSAGLRGSGAALKGAESYGGQLGLTYALNPYISGLQNLAYGGLQAAGQGAGLTMAAGTNIGQDYMTAANARAQALIQAANAQAANQGSLTQDIFGGLGLGAGLLMGYPGLGSAIGGAFGNIFNPTPNMGGGGGIPGAMAGDMAFRADGGPLYGGQPAVVGEMGPEVFVPDQPGYVIPNHLVPYTRSLRWTGGGYDGGSMALGR